MPHQFNTKYAGTQPRRPTIAVVSDLFTFSYPNPDKPELKKACDARFLLIVQEFAWLGSIDVFQGVTDAAKAHGTNVLYAAGGPLHTVAGQPMARSLLLSLVGPDNADGIIIVSSLLATASSREEFITFCKQYEPLPMVSVGLTLPDMPSITIANYAGIYDEVGHLIDVHGYRRIAFIRGPEGHQEAEERLRGYTDALTAHGIPIDPALIVPGQFSIGSGAQAIITLLDQRGVEFEAVVAASDQMALGALEALESRGIHVPGQVALAGFDDIDQARYANPALTTVRQPLYAMGARALETLLARMAGEDVAEEVQVPTVCIIRESCGCLRQEVTHAQDARLIRTKQIIRRMSDLGGELLTTFHVAGILDVLARELPRLGIPRCYLALYEETDTYRYPDPPPEWARLVLAYTEQGRLELPPNGQRFPSRWLLPPNSLPTEQPSVMVVTSLDTQNQLLGFVVFEDRLEEKLFYRDLRLQISSALHSALLVQRLQARSAELARQQYVLNTFMENVPDRIYFKDLQSRFTRANHALAYHLGLSDPAQQIGKSDWDFFPEELARAKHEQEKLIISTGQPILGLQEPDGMGRWALTTKMPLRDEHGAIIGTFGISHDITELKQAQAELQRAYADIEQRVAERTAELQREIAERKQAQAEREVLIAELETKNAELERFTYTVSHDLKSPLITIGGFVGFLEKDALAGDQEQINVDIAHINDAVARMQRLLDELLELSRIGRQMNPPGAISFADIVHEAIALARGRIAAHGVAVEIAPDFPVVYGDRARLVEVVQNLVDNACKFMGEQPQPRIEIGVRNGEAEPVFYVRDNGIGIEPQYHNKVFGLFEKLNPQSEGTGIGLALVKRIIETHGGKIWIESTGKDDGTTFYFTLPEHKTDDGA